MARERKKHGKAALSLSQLIDHVDVQLQNDADHDGYLSYKEFHAAKEHFAHHK
jgi:hypothetical protein